MGLESWGMLINFDKAMMKGHRVLTKATALRNCNWCAWESPLAVGCFAAEDRRTPPDTPVSLVLSLLRRNLPKKRTYKWIRRRRRTRCGCADVESKSDHRLTQKVHGLSFPSEEPTAHHTASTPKRQPTNMQNTKSMTQREGECKVVSPTISCPTPTLSQPSSQYKQTTTTSQQSKQDTPCSENAHKPHVHR